LPSNIARINFYRSNKLQSQPKEKFTTKREYFYVGSVSNEAYTNASDLSVIFEDSGLAPGYLLQYNKMEIPPRARFIKNHKGRMWLAYTSYAEGNTEAWANASAGADDYNTYPHRVFVSSVGGGGNFEPGVFYTDQFIDIDPKGSGITGIWSYQNQIMVVFKANSMWAIMGDDPHPVTGNLRVRNISNTVGCIAPESICEVEGRLVFLSNSGVYYWDGGSKPAPLKTDNIVDTVQGISDSKKKEVVSVYDRKQRELLMAYSDSETGGYNRKIAKFDIRTSAWSIDEYSIGMGAFINIDEPDEGSKVYTGFDDGAGNRFVYGSIGQLNFGSSSRYLFNTSTSEWEGNDIQFEFQTKFYDAGFPFMDKRFMAVVIDLKTTEELTLHVLCDNRLDTRSDDSGFTISLPAQDALIWAGTTGSGEPVGRRWYRAAADDILNNQLQNDNRWAKIGQGTSLIYLDDRCWGKRISLIISGAVQESINIDSITVFYKPLEGVREN
jgi:hypothetical protein